MNRVVTSKAEGAPVLDLPLEIPKEEWLHRLDIFSAQHHGWMSNLEIIEPNGQSRIEARDLPFEGINVDQRGSDIVEITLEKSPNDRIVHLITHVRGIILRSADELDIQSEEGKTVLRCRAPEVM